MAGFELELKRAVTVKCVGALATTTLDLSTSTGPRSSGKGGGVAAELLMADGKSYRPKSCGHCHDDEKQSRSIATKCL